MSYLINLISEQGNRVNNSYPLAVTDLLLALFLIIGFLIYLHRFPVFKVVVGVVFLLILSAASFIAGFTFTSLVLGMVSGLILFSLPSIFAPEVRHYLDKLGRFYHWRPTVSKKRKMEKLIENLTAAVLDLAEKKIGAIIVIQRKTKLGHLIDTGITIDALFGAKLLESIFYPNSALHDGAVVLAGDRVAAAKCVIQVSPQVKLDPPFGLRHRAGLAITQETDAVSLIVSEQRGEISLAENGILTTNLSKFELSEKLTTLLSK